MATFYELSFTPNEMHALREAIALGAFHSYAEQTRQELKRPVDTGHEMHLQARLDALSTAAQQIITAEATYTGRDAAQPFDGSQA